MRDVIYLCPSTPENTCTWEGHQGEVVTHFEDDHKEYFLDINMLEIDVNEEKANNYLMNLFNETYLIQTKYIKNSDTIQLKVRYLGEEIRAAKISYYVEVICGNFGFTSKNSESGFNTITNSDGTIFIDVQSIKVTAGKRILDNLLVWIHIENEFTQYQYKSMRRRQVDSKTLESRSRESFKRLSSYRTSMRKSSIDSVEYVQAINKIIETKRRSSVYETPDIYERFINEITEEIFRDAMEEIEFSKNDNSKNEDHRSLSVEKISIDATDVSYEEHLESQIIKYEETKIFQSSSNVQRFRIEINIPYFEEDIVSSIQVATHQIPNTEFLIEEATITDAEDLHPSNWSLNANEQTRTSNTQKDIKQQNRLSEAEELYLTSLNRIKCQNCKIIMIPPIFMCSEGHSVCLTCKTLNCDICGIEVTDIRNIDLEEISRSVTHPCRFADKGCPEMHSCYEIRRHEIYCEYFTYKCPLCLVFGKYYDIKRHFRLLHPSLKIVETAENSFGRNSEFVFANKYGIFYCTAPLKVNSIEWTVCFCGIERITFVCKVKVTGKKCEKMYSLQRDENGYTRKSVIFLDELKSLRLKDKHAVLYLSDF